MADSKALTHRERWLLRAKIGRRGSEVGAVTKDSIAKQTLTQVFGPKAEEEFFKVLNENYDKEYAPRLAEKKAAIDKFRKMLKPDVKEDENLFQLAADYFLEFEDENHGAHALEEHLWEDGTFCHNTGYFDDQEFDDIKCNLRSSDHIMSFGSILGNKAWKLDWETFQSVIRICERFKAMGFAPAVITICESDGEDHLYWIQDAADACMDSSGWTRFYVATCKEEPSKEDPSKESGQSH